MKRTGLMLCTWMLLSIGSVSVTAQVNISATLGLQLPMGDLGDGLNVGFGLNTAVKYPIKDNMIVGLNLGLNRFGGSYDSRGLFIPVTALFEYHVQVDDAFPYIGMDMGLYHYSYKFRWGGTNYSGSEAYFGFAPNLGFVYPLDGALSLTGNMKVHVVLADGGSVSWFGLNGGIIYNL